MIFGIPGSGKSTFALRLSHLLNLPLFHLDKYFFTSGWQERKYEEFLAIQKEIVEQDSWIIDGNATRSLEIRYKEADVVIYFRFNRLLCFYRVFKRLISKKSISLNARAALFSIFVSIVALSAASHMGIRRLFRASRRSEPSFLRAIMTGIGTVLLCTEIVKILLQKEPFLITF
jgi:broad-specificity NMP kinase